MKGASNTACPLPNLYLIQFFFSLILTLARRPKEYRTSGKPTLEYVPAVANPFYRKEHNMRIRVSLLVLFVFFVTPTFAQKRSITENLGEIWGVNVDSVSEVLSQELTEKEKKKLDELSDFNFGDL